MSHKEDVLGTGISLVDVDGVVSVLDQGVTVAICNVHSVMSARRDRTLHAALEDTDIATPDGMPLVWALRAFGHGEQTRCTGIDVLELAFEQGTNLSHFFYGSTEATLVELRSAMADRYPTAVIAGAISPPFRPLSEEEDEAHLARIRESGANVVWVGLGMPKQELWMARVRHRLPGVSLVGVGAAFDWLAGNVSRAPEWMRDAGLEWLYRLSREPRRLWRRYVFNNPAYLLLLGIEIVRRKVTRRQA